MKSNHSKCIGSTRSRPTDAGDESRLFMKAWVRGPNSQLYLTLSIIFRRESIKDVCAETSVPQNMTVDSREKVKHL